LQFDDVILQNGMAKSGNYWLYACLQALMAEAGVPMRSYIQRHPIYERARTWTLSFPEQASIDVIDITPQGYVTRISSKFSEPIPDLEPYFAQVRHLWSHSPYRGALSEAVYRRCKAVFYVVRDPRDALLSQADFMYSDYGLAHLNPPAPDRASFLEERASSYPVHWRNHVSGHLDAQASSAFCLVQYEAMQRDLPGELARMAAALDVPRPDPSRLEALAAGLGFDAMKARTGGGHLNRGRSGRWRAALTVAQIDGFKTRAGALMADLGYDLD
jgi:aryl sulfotransferase